MPKTQNISDKSLNGMSFSDLLDYKRELIKNIFEICIPLNDDETLRLEHLSAECDAVDTLLEQVPL